MTINTSRRQALAISAAMAFHLASPRAFATSAQKHSLSGFDLSGKPVHLQDFSGKVVMVSFVTGDCAVCAGELRLMREFYSANQSRGFVQLAVSLDRRPRDYRQLAEFMITGAPAPQRFPMVWRLHANHQDSFGPMSRTPTHVILDRQATEFRRREGGMQSGDWDELWSLMG
ncbi:peroxiredoxin family protein [Polaromonas sp.]|uniref:peroxiredoxin family protein n=1 Tax=Polaromonas sp. TaxID=1869339 RepID=UPI0035627C54